MRIRTVKPEFWQDEEISALSPEAALLALGLLNLADDEGFFLWIPKLIEATIFPLRELSLSIHALLTELSDMAYIKVMEGSSGKQFGQVVNFSKHQRVSRPTPSKISPLISDCESSLTPHGELSEDSAPEQGTGNGDRGKGTGSDGSQIAAAAPSMISKIVQSYPKQSHFRESHESAEAAIARNAKRKGISPQLSAYEILAGTEAIAVKLCEWSIAERNRFAPTPPNFFNGDRWADEPSTFESRQNQAPEDDEESTLNLGGRSARKVTDLRQS